MKKIILFTVLLALLIIGSTYAQTQTAEFYNVKGGQNADGNGIRFWNSDYYKIHMGNKDEYHYGPVTGYSIKSNMYTPDTKRGWTWGGHEEAPIAALNTQGNFQVAGWVQAGSLKLSNSAGDAYLQNATGYIGIRPADATHGLIIRDYTGQSLTWSGLRHVDAPNIDRLEFAVMNSDYSTLVITENKRVGIGIKYPGSKLTVSSSANEKGISSHNSEYGDSHFPWSNGWNYITGKGTIFRDTDNAEVMRVRADGKVVIGEPDVVTIPGDYKLYVDNGILTERVKVARVGSGDWADYVFAEGYDLNSTEEVEKFIKENKHLPNVPSAEEVSKNGVDMVEMDATLLRQIEELWLHVIELKKENELLKNEVKTLLSNN